MNQSQKSCEELYDNSSDEMKKLVEICNTMSYGSRMSGWGWGGCCIALTKESDCEKLVDQIISQYYLNKENHLAITDDLKMYVFTSKPGTSANILDPQYEFWY
jgi:galactokinase